jgi:hypothetical protein
MKYNNKIIQTVIYGMESSNIAKAIKFAPKELKKAVFDSFAPSFLPSFKKEVKEVEISKEESKKLLDELLNKIQNTTVTE